MRYFRQFDIGDTYRLSYGRLQLARPTILTGFKKQGCPVETVIERGTARLLLSSATLPERFRKAAQAYAPIPDGIGFFVIDDPANAIVLLIPCSEILRSCYSPTKSTEAEYLYSWLQRPNSAPTFRRLLQAAPFYHRDLDKHDLETKNRDGEQELAELLPRALIHGRHGQPLPYLIRPPIRGAVVVSGFGFTYSDEIGDVVFILSDLNIWRGNTSVHAATTDW